MLLNWISFELDLPMGPEWGDMTDLSGLQHCPYLYLVLGILADSCHSVLPVAHIALGYEEHQQPLEGCASLIVPVAFLTQSHRCVGVGRP